MPVSPGDRFQPKARDWNKLKDNLPSWQAPSGAPGVVGRIPAMTATLFWYGVRQPVLGEAVVMSPNPPGGTRVLPSAATVPIDPEMNVLDEEKTLWGYPTPAVEIMEPAYSPPRLNDHVAICVSPRKHLFAIHGFAWTRVRLLRPWHRYARRCFQQPGDGEVEIENSVGCLDSCAWGPVQIIQIANPLNLSSDWFWAFVRL
jgi:hypothetical protein